MKIVGWGRAGKLLLALGVPGAVFGIATAVQASIPDASGLIHGCYQKNVGNLRVIDAKTDSCRPSEVELNWNQTRPKGTTGPTGPKGATGAAATAIWAIVNEDGSLRQGSHVASTALVSTTEYGVTFDHDVSACAYTVTQRPSDGVFDTAQMLYEATAKPFGNVDRVEVDVHTEGGGVPTQQESFSLVVTC